VPEADTLVVAVGDVSGKGAPAALYGAFAAEQVRSRTLRRRFTPDRFSVAGVLRAMNTNLHERHLEEYYCTLCYAFFDFRRRTVTLSNSGSAVPDSLLSGEVRTDRVARCAARVVPGHHL
jgi:sigma-B regulation protein RsbU (phosphoserine phosphatase)